MAIFGTSKKEKKEKVTRVSHTRAVTLTGGVAHDILRAPWFSEKALIGTEKGVYVFEVLPRATKADIAAAVKEIYGVAPRMVRVVNLPAKSKSMRTRRGIGMRSARSKAYVYLNAGDTIQFA